MTATAGVDPSASMVRRAAEAFSNGHYAYALQLYEQLARLIGRQQFFANLTICEKRLAQREHPISGVPPTETQERCVESSLLLGPHPIWRELATYQVKELHLTYAMELPSKLTRSADKVVVVLVTALDNRKKLIEPKCSKLHWSSRFRSHYVYLKAPQGGALQADLKIPVPAGAHTVRLGFRTFEVPPNVNVKLLGLAVGTSAFARPPEQVIQLMAEGWPIEHDTTKPTLVAVLDEFTTNCLRNDVNLVAPRPDNWLALTDRTRPLLAFIESAWKGNQGSWQYRVGKYNLSPGKELAELCSHARTVGMPTVFWNKEDPVHHSKFMGAASLADHIFTTDERMVHSYVSRTGNKSVHVLPFAAAPHLHFPASLEGRLHRCCFAGSWYGNRHEKRGASMAWLLGAAKKHGLDIYDRNSGTGEFAFPPELAGHTKPGVPYEELCSIYRQYRVFLNVNSVEDSPTMFSRRVFELLACGTPVVSTPALGIERILGTDAVWLVRNEQEADEAITTLLDNDEEWLRRSRAGIRQVFAAHTYAHRLDDVFRVAGISERIARNPNILLIVHVADREDVERLDSFVRTQTYANFRILTSGNHASRCAERLAGPRLLDQTPLHHALADFDAVGLIDLRCSYGPNYLNDLINAMKYRPEADGWAKALTHDSFCFGPAWLGSASLLRPGVFSEIQRELMQDNRRIRNGHGVVSIDVSEFASAQTTPM